AVLGFRGRRKRSCFSLLCFLVCSLTSCKGCRRRDCQCRRASSFRPRSPASRCIRFFVVAIVLVILILRSCVSTTSSSRRASSSAAATFSNARSLATGAAVVFVNPLPLFIVPSLLTSARGTISI
ncbi:unnamed protein product, partial [Ectocarpus sp. 12 AP-2014]